MTRSDLAAAALLATATFAVYNSNGREIGTFDSQPTKYAARELLLRGTLSLNHVVGRIPALAERPGFVLAEDGRYRSAYSPVPAIGAAAIAWPAWRAGLIDLGAPLSPNLIAALAASVLAAISTALVFLVGRRSLPRLRAILLAVGYGAGTGMWPTVSQTLWQHETAIFGLAAAVFAFTAPRIRVPHAVAIGVGLALAGSSRMQLAPAIAVVLAGTFARAGWRPALLSASIVAAGAAALIRVNLLWFGSPLGAAPLLEALHDSVHAVSHSFRLSVDGLAGLLASPSRGLLVFSPIVLVTLWSVRDLAAAGWRSPLRWCVTAAFVQFLLYASYSVWWGGHTYGPRYMLDVLPLLAPVAAVGLARIHGPIWTGLAGTALAWSILAAATGAFGFPHDRWNTDPADVDRHHERLWDWRDPQIVRCWQRGPSPQNFGLFDRAAFRPDR
jgi:MFS family permease